MSTSYDPMCSECGRILSGGWFELLGGVRLCGLCYNKQFGSALVKHPINSDDKPNTLVNYCYNCGQVVRDQKYCHNCGKLLMWNTTNED